MKNAAVAVSEELLTAKMRFRFQGRVPIQQQCMLQALPKLRHSLPMDNTSAYVSACPPVHPVASTTFIPIRGQDYCQGSLDDRKEGGKQRCFPNC